MSGPTWKVVPPPAAHSFETYGRNVFSAIPTLYSGVKFRSRLEARWAAFFDLNRLYWEYEPVDLNGWIPDFYLVIPCPHSECIHDVGGKHELHVEIKPYRDLRHFDGHPVTKLDPYASPHPAKFGVTPEHTEWEMVHGHGGGIYGILDWIDDYNWRNAWNEAGNIVQWRRPS